MATRQATPWMAVTVVTAGLIGLLALVANASFWVDRHIADEASFTDTATAVLLTQEAREVMAQRIVEELVEEAPALILIQNPLGDVVVSILATPVMEPAVVALATEIHHQITTGDPSAVVVSLLEVKDALVVLLDEVAPGISELIPDRFFTSIEVIDAGVLPSYATAVGAAPWLWPLTAAIAIVLGVALVLLVPVRAVGLLAVGMAVAGAGVLGLGLAAVARAPILDVVTDPALRTLAELAYVEFRQSYVAQTLWLVVAGVFAAGAGAVWLAFVRFGPAPAA